MRRPAQPLYGQAVERHRFISRWAKNAFAAACGAAWPLRPGAVVSLDA